MESESPQASTAETGSPAPHPVPNLRRGAGKGNTHRLTTGVYTKRRLPLSPAEEREVDALLALPHTILPDRAAAEEIVRLRSLIARIDDALADGRVETDGHARNLIDYRRRASDCLRAWLEQFGMTDHSLPYEPPTRRQLRPRGAIPSQASPDPRAGSVHCPRFVDSANPLSGELRG